MIINVTIGADPELFIINEKTGKVVSSIGIIPGVKGNPWVGEDMPSGFGLEIDNILGEFNIPPARDRQSFVNSIEYMKNYIDRYVKEKNPDLGIKCSASEEVDEDQLQSDEARLFGCSPDFNVYTQSENPRPKGDRTNLRSTGFHIHIGYTGNNVDESLQLVKYLDLYLGVPSVIKDQDRRRRSLYGKAGSFRLTPYGLEYRVLSGAMMATPELTGFVYDQTVKAIDAYNVGAALCNSGVVMSTINNTDVEGAKNLVKKLNLEGQPVNSRGSNRSEAIGVIDPNDLDRLRVSVQESLRAVRVSTSTGVHYTTT